MAKKCADILKEMGADHIDYTKELGPFDNTTYQSTHNTGGVHYGK